MQTVFHLLWYRLFAEQLLDVFVVGLIVVAAVVVADEHHQSYLKLERE